MSEPCDYCDDTELVYTLESDRGRKHRCIRCLAVEQIQQQFSLPFDAWLDRDQVDPPDHPDAPDFEPFDPRRHDYETAKAWARILARLVEDDPILKENADDIGAVFEDTRTFVENVMGADAYKRPSEIREGPNAR